MGGEGGWLVEPVVRHISSKGELYNVQIAPLTLTVPFYMSLCESALFTSHRHICQ